MRWRERPLETSCPYLLVDACYLKVRWGEHVGDLALLVVVGINKQGYREVLAVESAAGERKEAYRNLFRGLLERGLLGVQLVVSDDHEAIKQAVATELPDAIWQRCVVHFERNVLAHVRSGSRPRERLRRTSLATTVRAFRRPWRYSSEGWRRRCRSSRSPTRTSG